MDIEGYPFIRNECLRIEYCFIDGRLEAEEFTAFPPRDIAYDFGIIYYPLLPETRTTAMIP